jgi:hypothetical protein
MPVVLLCHFDGTNGSTTFTDVSPSAHTLTNVGNTALVSTTNPKFGTGCTSFTAGSGTRIEANYSADFNFGAGQFTLEAWVYYTVAPGAGTQAFLTQWPGGASTNIGWYFGMVGGQLTFFYSTTGTDNPGPGAAYTPTLNTWIHYAVDRDASNVLRVYANGVVIASATAAVTFFASTRNVNIGCNDTSAQGLTGIMDEVRITKGTARYGGAFTPPTAPFTDTSALTTQLAVEQWVSAAPVLQLTQVAIEEWGAPTAPALQLTQIAIEEWASLGIVPPTGPAYALSASRAGIGSAVVWQTGTSTFALPLSAIVAEATAAPAPPVGGAVQARVMVLD